MPIDAEHVNSPSGDESTVVVTVIKVVIFATFLMPLVQFTFYNNSAVENNTPAQWKSENKPMIKYSVNFMVEEKTEDKEVDIVRKIIPQQPSCPRSQMLLILKDICEEVVIKYELCTFEDFHNRDKHKIPKHYGGHSYSSSKQVPQLPAIVNWALGGFLMTSLGAALVELYKAKQHPEKKNGKNPLSRKCSLADLTVLKHHRKEMVRRDSLMEVPEERLYSKQMGRTMSRPPMRSN